MQINSLPCEFIADYLQLIKNSNYNIHSQMWKTCNSFLNTLLLLLQSNACRAGYPIGMKITTL